VSAVLADVTDRARAADAQRESEAKSRLMAMMNHEVRTPLNSILGFAHLLTDPRLGDLNDKQRRYVSNIQISGNHLLALVNDSLDLAKLDAGATPVTLAAVAIKAALEQAADQVRPLAEARGLALRVEMAGALSAFADTRQLIQVLLNLLSNAIRHTRAGGTVTMAARAEGSVVSISVADTGEGIAREDLPRLFEEFYQAANHAPGGVGLGLAISRRLVQVMGGSIAVESELGKGSTFTVRLPAGGT
jgi:signal transduction histidine kinase